MSLHQYAQAHELLTASMRDALLNSPERAVDAPGFKESLAAGTYTAADLVLDHFAGATGDASLNELLRIVGLAAQGQDMHLRAAAWVASVSKHHADFHFADLVERWEFAGAPERAEVVA